MSDYITTHLPEHAARIAEATKARSAAERAFIGARNAMGDADAALWKARNEASAAAVQHFRENARRPRTVPADLVERVAVALEPIDWPKLSKSIRAGLIVTAWPAKGGVDLTMYDVGAPANNGAAPEWRRLDTVTIKPNGCPAGLGLRKRLVSEDDMTALMAIAGGE